MGISRGAADVPPTEEDVASSGYGGVGEREGCVGNRESISSNASVFDGCILNAARRSVWEPQMCGRNTWPTYSPFIASSVRPIILRALARR